MTDDIKSIVARFTKVAEDMMNTANDQSSGTISPDEAQEALGVVVDELTAIIAAIPGEGANKEEPEKPEPTQPSEDSQKVSKLEKEVKDLTDKLSIKEREDIAEDYAGLFEPAQHDAKVKEVLDSKDSNDIWAVKIDAIDEFQNSKTEQPYKRAQTVSYTKVARQSDNRLMYL